MKQVDPDLRPVTGMTDAEIKEQIADLDRRFIDLRSNCDGMSGSPGEWMIERLDELRTALARRHISYARS